MVAVGDRRTHSAHLSSLLLQISQTAAAIKARHEQRWPSSLSQPPPSEPVTVQPLELTIPQSFYFQLDSIPIPPGLRAKVLSELPGLMSRYSDDFQRHILSLTTTAVSPKLRLALPAIITRLRGIFQTHFEQETLPFILSKIAANQSTVEYENQPRFNKEYIPFLEKYFALDAYPSIRDQEVMAQKSGMTRRQIEVWFQNHRRVLRKQGIIPKKRQASSGSVIPEDPKSYIIEGLPSVLREASPVPQPNANTIEIVEHLVSQETELDRLDFDPSKKYESIDRPRYPRTSDTTPNPLDAPAASSAPPPFKPSSLIPNELQFRNLPPRPFFPSPAWDRRPYVAPTPPSVVPPKKKGKSGRKAPSQAELAAIDNLVEEFGFLSINRGRKEANTPEHHKRHYDDISSTVPPAATYAKTVVPPTGRHPACCWHPSQLVQTPTTSSTSTAASSPQTKKKRSGLPNRKPRNSPRRPRGSPAPSNTSTTTMRSSLSRSPSPHASSRTPSLESSSSRRASLSSSEADTPLFTPVSLPAELPVPDLNLDFDLGGYALPEGYAPSVPGHLFRQAATNSLLWEPRYKIRYRHSKEPRKEENYWLMYTERRKTDNLALGYIDRIVDNRVGRCGFAREVCKMGFDVWDALEIEFDGLEGSFEYHDVESKKVDVTRRYWIQIIMQGITRCYAVRLWSGIPEKKVSFVEAYSALSCFFGKLPGEMSSILDDLAKGAKEFVLAAGCSLEDVKAVCIKICEFLRSVGFGPVDSTSFHDIHNQFPHCYLTTRRHTIPISLVHVFVAIARSLGIEANPTDFPLRVLAHVSEPAEDKDDFYVDVFGSAQSPILSLRDDIPLLLSRQGIAVDRMMDFIAPCGPTPMLLRAGRNIMASIHTPRGSPSLLAQTAITLVFTLHIQLGGRKELIPQFVAGCDPIDCATFISEAMVETYPEGSELRDRLQGGVDEELEQEEKEARVVHYRSFEETSVQHFVGLVFRHRQYKYNGCIFGWDPVCAASDQWKTEMGVRSLLRAGDQPFYHCFCEDNSVRYVAEDNIEPLSDPSKELFDNFQANVPMLPRYFTGIHSREGRDSSRARFLLSPEAQKAYPEDDAIGHAWVTQVE
ncbi:hypothetical protein VNI00_002021 [Paramarasmius palmivorus]|uniref:Homeobox domain-containing protein n=1 Tax=Paramarasmius palmivorus TaxID=297713 RepID=A0AAW0E3N1_9AGAR